MQHLDLDRFVPDFSSIPRLGARVHRAAMLDWRRLETRLSHHEVALEAEMVQLWGFLHASHASLFPEKSDELREVWFQLDPDNQSILKFNGESYSLERQISEVERLLSSTSRRSQARFSLVSYAEGGQRLSSLLHREHRLRTAVNLYTSTFRNAVEARLYQFIRSVQGERELHPGVSFEGAFLIENEGRTRLITCAPVSSRLQWHRGITYSTAPQPTE